MAIYIWVIIVILALFAIWAIFTYNAFIRLRNNVENSWAQIDVQLKRRTDLIPNLIKTVKGYVKHERETLEAVTNARSELMKAEGDTKETARADNMLSDALKSLFAVAEAYPDLKANQNFMQLQEELSGTENKIAAARQYYNDIVMQYNTKRESFPDNLLSGLFKFTEKDLFEIDETEREVPDVKF